MRSVPVFRIFVKAVSVILVFFPLAFSHGKTITVHTGGQVDKGVVVDAASVKVVRGASSQAVFKCGDDVQWLGATGEPRIPWKIFTVLLGPDADAPSVAADVNADYELAGKRHEVEPIPPMGTRIDGRDIVVWPTDKRIVDGRDADIYENDAFWPSEKVRLSGVGKLRGWQLAEIAVPLVLYNPVSGQLKHLSNTDVVITYDCLSAANGKSKLAEKTDRIGRSRVEKLAVNFAQFGGDYAYESADTGWAVELAGQAGSVAASSFGSVYAIITTTAIQSASSALNSFIGHKSNLGFDVRVITEADFGGGQGDTAANNIRQWLRENYISQNILYVLLLGNPHPTDGYVPMKSCYSSNVVPSDFFYADLSGNWDLNGNGVYGEWDDNGPGGVDRYWEVLVGRIPYYGNISDTDAILNKIIDYENQIEDTDWRSNALLPMVPFDGSTPSYQLGEQIKQNFLVPRDWGFHRLYNENYGLNPPPETVPSSIDNVTNVWRQNPFGLVVWMTHGSSHTAGGVMDTGHVPSLDDDYPTFTWQASCSNSHPETTDNLSYTLLKNGAIATVGATRVSVYWIGETNFTNSTSIGGMGYQYSRNLIAESMTCGAAFYELKQALSPGLWENFVVMNLYGDASVGLAPPDRPSLVGYWKLDETVGTEAADSAGQNDGTLIGGVTFDNNSVQGKIGGAIELDGTNDYISHGLSLPRLAGTISHWLYPDQLRQMVACYESDGTAAGAYNGFGYGYEESALEIHTGIQDDGKWFFVYQDGAIADDAYVKFSAGDVIPQRWSHVAVTWQVNGDAILYVNGLEVGREDMSGKTFASMATTVRQIGRVGDGTASRHWDGRIDDVRVYDYALGSTAIKSLATGMEAWLKFDDNAGLIAADSVSNNYGILTGGLTFDDDSVVGKINEALEFDGLDDYVWHGSSLPRSTGTISHWLYPNQVRQMVACYESDGTAAGTYNGFGASSEAGALEINTGIQNDNKWFFVYQNGVIAENALVSFSAGDVTEGQWSHVAVTWDVDADVILYVNGLEVGREDMSGKTFESRAGTVHQIGRVGDGTASRHWDGRIDDFRIYNRALSQDEITELVASRVAWLKFDETEGLTAKNSFDDRDGTLEGNLIWKPYGGKICGALEFDGFDDYVVRAFSLPRESGTILHWLYPDQARQMVACYESDGTEVGTYNGFGALSEAGALELHTGIQNDNKWFFVYQDGVWANNASVSFSAGNVVAEQWSHVAVTWNINADAILYVNGSEVGREDMSGKNFESRTPVVRQIGRVGDSSATRHWDGLIDDLRVYSRSFSPEEIAEIYRYGMTGDLNYDSNVDLADLGVFSDQYLQQSGYFESDGLVVMEAENYFYKGAGCGTLQGSSWTALAGGGAAGGGYVQASPDIGLRSDYDSETYSPHLSFRINFATPGTYYLWLKAKAQDGGSNSAYYGLDNVAISQDSSTAIAIPITSDFSWTSDSTDSERLTVTVDSAGRHSLDIWMREDGAEIDRVLLTTDESYNPGADEPQESQYEPDELPADLNTDGLVNLGDFASFADQWLK